MTTKIQDFLVLLLIFFTTSIQAQNTYLYWDFEAMDGAEDALVEIFDNFFEENEITYKSGGWALMRNAIGGDNIHTHRIILYGDIYNWGYTEERETPDLDWETTYCKLTINTSSAALTGADNPITKAIAAIINDFFIFSSKYMMYLKNVLLNKLHKNGSTFSNVSGPPKLKRITAFFICNFLLYLPNIQTY